MQNNQKGFGVVKVLLVGLLSLLIGGGLGLLAWNVWGKPDTKQIATTVCTTKLPNSDNKAFALPSGWNWYDLKDAGVRYAYPVNWQSPTNQTNSGDQKYVISFTVGSSGADATVTLSPDCSDFQSNLSKINNGTFDTSDDKTTTKAIKHSQSSYSSLSHWSSDAGNQYQLVTYNLVGVGSIKTVTVEYGVVAGSEVCPDDKLAASNQPKCLTQAISDEVDKVISSLQKTQ